MKLFQTHQITCKPSFDSGADIYLYLTPPETTMATHVFHQACTLNKLTPLHTIQSKTLTHIVTLYTTLKASRYRFYETLNLPNFLGR